MPGSKVSDSETRYSGGLADLSRPVDVTRLDAHLASKRVDDTGTIGSDKTRFRLALESVHDLAPVRKLLERRFIPHIP